MFSPFVHISLFVAKSSRERAKQATEAMPSRGIAQQICLNIVDLPVAGGPRTDPEGDPGAQGSVTAVDTLDRDIAGIYF